MFGGVELAKITDPDKSVYSGYGIGLDTLVEYSLPDSSIGKNVIISGVHMSSFLHIDKKRKDVLVIGKGPIQGLNDTTLAAETQYSINFTRLGIKSCLIQHYNGSRSFLFVNATKIYQFKAKDFEIKKYPLCLENISGDFSANNMQNSWLNRYELNGLNYGVIRRRNEF